MSPQQEFIEAFYLFLDRKELIQLSIRQKELLVEVVHKWRHSCNRLIMLEDDE